jgi:ParB/RepB/Spo0J family partition protein
MTGQTDITDSRLPDAYDELVSIGRLRHGKHNVRRSPPSQNLRRSIEHDGIETPLVARRSNGDGDMLHITDGWQRYQAAADLGWQKMPVNIYDETIAALEAAERRSMVDEWSTYHAAKHVHSVFQESNTEDQDEDELIKHIAERTRRTTPTVRRYLKAFQLPDVLLPLLKEPRNVTDAEYRRLKKDMPEVRQYGGLSWQVAEEIGPYCGEVPDDRIIQVALRTLKYKSENAIAFVHQVLDADDESKTLQQAEYELFNGVTPEEECRMQIPRFTMRLDPNKRKAVMDHLQARKLHLSDAVEQQVREFADEVNGDIDADKSLDQYN